MTVSRHASFRRVHESKKDGWLVFILCSAVESITPTRNLLSSAALSIDRLHVKYKGSRSYLYISPRDKNAFMRDLVAVCPQLRYDGERVVRAEKNPA